MPAPLVASPQHERPADKPPLLLAPRVQDFTAAVELAPDAPVPYLNRAIAYESLGVESAAAGDVARAQQLYEQAAADCSRSILLDPAEFTAWFNR